MTEGNTSIVQLLGNTMSVLYNQQLSFTKLSQFKTSSQGTDRPVLTSEMALGRTAMSHEC